MAPPPRSGPWLAPVRLALVACVVCLSARSATAADAVVPVNIYQDGGLTANVSGICFRMRKEAIDACLEFGVFGFRERSCIAWANVVEERCQVTRCRCNLIAAAFKEHCRFALQLLNDPVQINMFCNAAEIDFRDYRCPSNCQWNMTNDTGLEGSVSVTTCEGGLAEFCMAKCGNYRDCWCRKQRSTPLPDVCHGNTVVEGYDENDVLISCANTPAECQHNTAGGICREYKHCKPDYCVIKEVECVSPNQCMDEGECDTNEGRCYFNQRPNGSPCNDELVYTDFDQCVRGDCAGTMNYCTFYNVSCGTLGPCMSGGLCHPFSGRCTYNITADGGTCDDGRRYTVEDQCVDGMCIGKPVNLCDEEGVVCQTPSSCYEPGVCNPDTGICTDPIPANGRECDDGDSLTTGETCIDGICIGQLAGDLNNKFQTIGTGECGDRDGRRMSRYLGDVEGGEHTCLQACLDDVQCAGYSYSYPVCSIYGSIRTGPPNDGRAWSFLLGSDPPAVMLEKALPTVPGQRQIVCRRKGLEGDSIPKELEEFYDRQEFFGTLQVTVFMTVLIVIFFSWPMVRCLRITLFGVPKETPVININDTQDEVGGQAEQDYHDDPGYPDEGPFDEGPFEGDQDLRAIAGPDGGGGPAEPPATETAAVAQQQ